MPDEAGIGFRVAFARLLDGLGVQQRTDDRGETPGRGMQFFDVGPKALGQPDAAILPQHLGKARDRFDGRREFRTREDCQERGQGLSGRFRRVAVVVRINHAAFGLDFPRRAVRSVTKEEPAGTDVP